MIEAKIFPAQDEYFTRMGAQTWTRRCRLALGLAIDIPGRVYHTEAYREQRGVWTQRDS